MRFCGNDIRIKISVMIFCRKYFYDYFTSENITKINKTIQKTKQQKYV